MKAVWYERNGGAKEVLIYGDLPTPQPAENEVRVQLFASGGQKAPHFKKAPAWEFQD